MPFVESLNKIIGICGTNGYRILFIRYLGAVGPVVISSARVPYVFGSLMPFLLIDLCSTRPVAAVLRVRGITTMNLRHIAISLCTRGITTMSRRFPAPQAIGTFRMKLLTGSFG